MKTQALRHVGTQALKKVRVPRDIAARSHRTGTLSKQEVGALATLVRNRVISAQRAADAAMTLHMKRVNRWRDQLNPIRGLTIARAVSLLEAGERGEYADLQWTYRFIEKRDATLRGAKKRILSAIKRLDWNIKVTPEEDLPPGATVAQAEAQGNSLRESYDAIDNLKCAVEFMALKEFRGFSHLEPHLNADGDCVHLEPVPQWHWVRDGISGDWEYNADARSGSAKGTPIDDHWFIIGECDDPIDEIALLCFIRKSMSQKDWDGFIEVYGIPWLFIIGPPNVPSGKESEYQEVAEAVVSDGRGYLPNGSDVKTAEAGVRSVNPFRDHISYQNEEIVMAATSGKLTMLSAPTGLNADQGDAHEETFNQIAQALALDVSEVFQAQFDARILLAAHEGEPTLAYFELAAKETTEPGQVLADAKTASDAGYQMDADELSEKSGYKLTIKTAPAAGNPSGIPALQNRKLDPRFRQAATAEIAKLRGDVLRPLRQRIMVATALKDDAAMIRELQSIYENRVAIYQETATSPETTKLAEAFFNTLGTSWLNGAIDHAQKTKEATR